MNKVLLIGILFLISSCDEPKSYATIFYFEQMDLLSIVAIDCSDMVRYSGLRKLQLTDKELFMSLTDVSKFYKKNSQYDPDVRYKVIFDNDTLCIDYFGRFIMNSEHRGQLDFIDKLEEFIQKNKKLSIPITEETPKPWNN